MIIKMICKKLNFKKFKIQRFEDYASI